MRIRHTASGFTLLELILSVTVLVVIMAVLVQVVTSVQNTWRRGSDSSDTTLAAQRILGVIGDDLAAALANDFAAPGLLGAEAVPAEGEAAETAGSDADLAPGEESKSPLVFAVFPETEVETDVEAESAEGADSAETASGFSRLLFTCEASRIVWNGGAADCSSVPIPSRRATDSRLRSVLGVLYSIEAAEDTEEEAAGESGEEAAAPVRYSLVRRVSGLKTDHEGDWWTDLEETVAGEVLARNVVWFSVTVPAFPAVATNETDTASYESYAAYATRTDDSLGLPSDVETGSLPALVDVVLGLVPERDLKQAEAIEDESERNKRIARSVRIYTRRYRIK